jgi:hypothetical protein
MSINVKNIEHLYDKSNIDMSVSGFQTDLWYYCVKNKIIHLKNILNKNRFSDYKYFIFSDCDVIYLNKNSNEWNNLENFIDNSENDIFFMRENTSEDVNSGFFIIKNNNNIESINVFFSEVLEIFNRSKKEEIPLGDQSIINNIKHKINYGFIPNDYVIFGTTIYNKNKSLFHHAVCCVNVDEKIEQINFIKQNIG